jgi:hypothetical protein
MKREAVLVHRRVIEERGEKGTDSTSHTNNAFSAACSSLVGWNQSPARETYRITTTLVKR